MPISAPLLNLLELMPRAAIVIDIKQQCVVYRNEAATQILGLAGDTAYSTQHLGRIITHTSSIGAIYTAVYQELQQEGKAVLHHINVENTNKHHERYDVHISYVNESKNAVYLLFERSEHELSLMEQQNTYYNNISEAAYSYPFHLDIQTRQMEFFDPKLEYLLTSEHKLSLVMEDFPKGVLASAILYEDDRDAYIQAVQRMYKGEPPQGTFRCYDPKGELLRYGLTYVVNRNDLGEPVTVVGDFIIQPEHVASIDTGLATPATTTSTDPSQTVVLAHQIKAHFFFNTLNTISALCKQDAAKADSAIQTFSTYMRSYMHLINENELIPFTQELTLVKSTLEIERLRFPNLFTYELDLQAIDFEVPPLTLQPIVENALLHGLRRTGKHGAIRISSCQVGDAICITIADNGMGFDTAILAKRQSVGLQNLMQRITLMLGGTVHFESQLGKGTTVTITLPSHCH